MASPLSTTSIEHLLTTLIERFESIKMERCADRAPKIPMQAEIRSLDFWRSIVAECLASFFLVFVVCGSCVPWSGHTAPAIGIALAAGFSVASLTLSFAHISGKSSSYHVTSFRKKPFLLSLPAMKMNVASFRFFFPIGSHFLSIDYHNRAGLSLLSLSARMRMRTVLIVFLLFSSASLFCLVYRRPHQSGGVFGVARHPQSISDEGLLVRDGSGRRVHRRCRTPLRVCEAEKGIH